MFKALFATAVVLFIFFSGVGFALTHHHTSIELMHIIGCGYATH